MAGHFARITNTFFTSLINRLGVRPPFRDGFELADFVQPVSLVDADISIPVTVTPVLLGGSFTAGIQVAPGAGAILADTGNLPAGTYTITIFIGFASMGVNQRGVIVAHRDAADAADIWSNLIAAPTGDSKIEFRQAFALNESMVVRVDQAFAAGERAQASIFATLTG